ncbi:hypothetical protein ElyMa_005790800 [Elysia marginata]|uniref:Vitellogenin domain-containing protein n=1 Tax=Elysia marginata TaxID=1093978 RepID=A0AAV4FRH8_9GAST|nr:hypothetical protein ElyMa_005790800 [Elysia marginata]
MVGLLLWWWRWCLAALLCATAEGFINNFRFKHSNVFNGNILPFKVKISGSYYVDVLGTPQLSFLTDKPEEAVVNAKSLKTTQLPVVCVGDTADMIVKVDKSATERLKTKLVAMEKLVGQGKLPDIEQLMSEWGPFLEIAPEYQCSPITLVPSTDDSTKGFTFSVEYLFNEYKSLIFMDQLGVGQFSYKRQLRLHDSSHVSGNPIRFCGGSAYTGEMFTVEPRPKCPLTSTEENRHHGRAVITVYKPNIVSVRRNVTRCLQRVTHVHCYENAIGKSRDAWRKSRSVNTPVTDCKRWIDTKNACPTFIRSMREDGDDQKDDYYQKNPHVCSFTKTVSQNNAAGEYRTNPYLNYDYELGSIHAFDMRSATLSMGFMEVAMPTVTMVTPWLNIPKNHEYKGSYQINNVTLVWEPFTPDELCLYVPRFRGEVSYIKYKKGDYKTEVDPDSDIEDYTLFLIADQYGAAFNVESDQLIRDLSKLNCMPHKTDYRTKVYQTGSDQIIVVTVVDEGYESRHDVSHIPKDMRHRGNEEQVHGAYNSIKYDAEGKRVLGVEHDNQHSPVKTKAGDPNRVHDLEKHFNSVRRTDGTTQPSAGPVHNEPTATDVLNYLNFKRVEIQKHNLHVRAMQNCFINQIDWDMYVQLLDINPSRAISNRINVAIEASLGGNGFYNVKRCELALGAVVIPTLNTNSSEPVSVNGKQFTVAQIVKHLGVIPDSNKCFAMPLILYTSKMTGVQVIGQLTLEGLINVQKLSYLEACTRNKAFVFTVNDNGHFFFDYKFKFSETVDNIRNATEKFLQASMPPSMIPRSSRFQTENDRHHELSKVHILTIVQPKNLKEKEYQHFPTGLFSNDMYSLAEHQSASLGMMKLMEEQNFERFATLQFSESWNRDRSSSDMGFFGGAGNFLDGVGDFFMKVETGEGNMLYGLGGGLGLALDGAGSGGGKLLDGAGSGIGKASKGFFGGIGDALSSTLMALALPLVALIILAVIIVLVYKHFKNGDNGDGGNHKNHTRDNDDDDDDDYDDDDDDDNNRNKKSADGGLPKVPFSSFVPQAAVANRAIDVFNRVKKGRKK